MGSYSHNTLRGQRNNLLSLSLTELEVSSGDFVSKANMKSFTCPVCGWNVKTTLGENDILDPDALYSKNHHPEMMNKPKKNFARLIKDE